MKRHQSLACAAVMCVVAIASAPPLLSQQSSGAIEHISVRPDGYGGNELSRDPAVNADGRFVAFVSGATDLTSKGAGGVFVRDRQTRTTARIPTPGAHAPGRPSISGDGRLVVFAANEDGSERTAIYLHDRQSGGTRQVSLNRDGDLGSIEPVISDDGRVVAYISQVAAEGLPDGVLDVVVINLESGATAFANTSTTGAVVSARFDPDYGIALSADGRVVAFTFGPALVAAQPGGQVYVRDLVAERTEIASLNTSGTPGDAGHFFRPAVSADGRFVAFPSVSALVMEDSNGMPDVFVRDRQLGRTERVSVDDAGQEASQGANLADSPSISADGRFVAFVSISPLTTGDTNSTYDVLVRDRLASRTVLVSGTENGVGDDISFGPALSRDGRTIAFSSEAANLSPATKNPAALIDVFARPWVVAPALRVETPNTRSDWGIGTTQRLAWVYDGAATDFDVEISRDNGNTWEFLARVPNRPGTSQSFYWQVEGPATNTARFRVSAVGDEDASDINDIGVDIATPFIAMLRPTPGQVLNAGQSALVFFTHNLGARTPIAIEANLNGDGWLAVATDAKTLGSTTSSFRWSVPAGLSGQVQLRVRALDGSGAAGVSGIIDVRDVSAAYSVLDLGTPGGRSSIAYGRNDTGDVVGYIRGGRTATAWASGAMRLLESVRPPGCQTASCALGRSASASAISETGMISRTASGEKALNHAAVWTDGDGVAWLALVAVHLHAHHARVPRGVVLD